MMYTAKQVQELVNTVSIWSAQNAGYYRVAVNTDRFITVSPADGPPRILLMVSDEEGYRMERVIVLQNYRRPVSQIIWDTLNSMVKEMEGETND